VNAASSEASQAVSSLSRRLGATAAARLPMPALNQL
jgi:hypothetical protein